MQRVVSHDSGTTFSRPKPPRTRTLAALGSATQEDAPPPYDSPDSEEAERSQDDAGSRSSVSVKHEVVVRSTHGLEEDANLGDDPSTSSQRFLRTPSPTRSLLSNENRPSPRTTYTIPPPTPRLLNSLSATNDALTAQLAALSSQLQSTSLQSRSRVRRLEKELAGVRGELSYVQARNDELERKRKEEEEREEELAKDAKMKRVEKLKEARERRLTHGVSAFQQMQAFSGSRPTFTPRTSPSLIRAAIRAVGPDYPSDDDENYEVPFDEAAANKSPAEEDADASDPHSHTLPSTRGQQAPPSTVLPSVQNQSATPSLLPSRIKLKGKRSFPSLSRAKKLGSWSTSFSSYTSTAFNSKSKGKGKARPRASITPMSFVPPSSRPISGNNPASSSTMFPSLSNTSRALMDIYASASEHDRDSVFAEAPPGTSSHLGPGLGSGFLSPRSDINRELLAGSGPINLSHRTLNNEIGLDDWRANFIKKSSLDELDLEPELRELLALTSSPTPQGNEDENQDEEDPAAASSSSRVVQGGNGQSAMDALSLALDPMRANEMRVLHGASSDGQEEHILPLGSLRDAPVETFYLLDRAVSARPMAFIDTTASSSPAPAVDRWQSAIGGVVPRNEERRRLGVGSSIAGTSASQRSRKKPLLARVLTSRLRDDTWGLYPDEDDDELLLNELEDDPPLRSPSLIRRELARSRLEETRERRISLSSPMKSHSISMPGAQQGHNDDEEPKSILRALAEKVGFPPQTSGAGTPSSTGYTVPRASRRSESQQPQLIENHTKNDEDSGEETATEHEALSTTTTASETGTSGASVSAEDDSFTLSEDDLDHLHRHPHAYSRAHAPLPHSSALVRTTAHQGDEDESTGTDRYSTTAIAHKIKKTTAMHTLLQVWMTVQFAVVIVVFVYIAVKKGPSKILGGGSGDRRGYEAPRVRSSRGAGTLVRRRQ